jgi:cytoskeletal protein RodZ
VTDDTAEKSGDKLAAFGRWLARERELRGLARDEVVRVVKVAPGVLDALESGDESLMPPRAYAVGYLRAYAAAVGLDADEVVLRYEEALGPKAASVAPRRAGLPTQVVAGVAIAAAILAAAVAWALLRS